MGINIIASIAALATAGTGVAATAMTVDPPGNSDSSKSQTWTGETLDITDDGTTWIGVDPDEPGFVHKLPGSSSSKSSKPSGKSSKPSGQPRAKKFVPRTSCSTVGTVNGVPYVVVRDADTLGNIARCNHTTVKAIAEINRIANPNRIHVGQRVSLRKAK